MPAIAYDSPVTEFQERHSIHFTGCYRRCGVYWRRIYQLDIQSVI